ncbi:MAG TPA: protein-L-isoaspartate(D-aspartate) O-methyltransferase [Miltoncostaeaceae bacterium]|nr:protein-L-isoaspartate(D-aspartate) O-methyltransferase [Miltoncostaeaceae bacterium]
MGAPSRDRLLAALGEVIRDRRVMEAMAAVPRECFVPEAHRHEAWVNAPLPIGRGQTISQPFVVAHMCELLELRGDETVLDVGTGSGYHAAVLSRLARRVVSIERHPSLSEWAAANLRAAGIAEVALVVGDGTGGHPPEAPYDAINVAAASAAGVPPALEEQLADGGRLVIPAGDGTQRLVRVRRTGDRLVREELGEVRFVPLVPGEGSAAGSSDAAGG